MNNSNKSRVISLKNTSSYLLTYLQYFQQLSLCIRLPSWLCTCTIATGLTIAQRACDAPCHKHVTVNEP